MRSIAPMRAAKIGYIVISVVMIALGAVLIILPEFSVSVLGTVFGILIIAFGAVKLVGYFSRDLYRLAFQYDLAFGILLIALGTLTLARPGSVMTFICISLGFYTLADCIFKIQTAIESRRFGISKWWLILIFAIACGIFGLILMFRPGEGSHILVIMLGATLVFEGILNLCTVLTAVRIIKNQLPDVVETEFSDESEE